jgi:chemotaxis response regulator CheB
MAKPGPDDSSRLQEYADALRRRLRMAGRVRVITHPRGRLGMSGPSLTTLRLASGPTGSDGGDPGAPSPPGSGCKARHASDFDNRVVKVLAIGASTGGPPALATLLAGLPATTSAPIVVVQHMADGFMEGLATWLDDICPLPVTLGCSGDRLAPGTVTIAPSGMNLVVDRRLRVTTCAPEPGQYHVPGIDVTFSSVAEGCGAESVGVLLTGMGSDGAVGLKRIRDLGGLTIGQDESTSAVYGMPAAAMSADAVEIQLSLPEICSAVRRILSTATTTATTTVGGTT